METQVYVRRVSFFKMPGGLNRIRCTSVQSATAAVSRSPLFDLEWPRGSRPRDGALNKVTVSFARDPPASKLLCRLMQGCSKASVR